MLFTIALIAAVLALAYHFYIKIFFYWERKGVPCEKPLPVIGNMKGIGSKYHFRNINQQIYDQFKGKSSFAGMYMFFRRTAMITDLDLIKQVMIKDFNYFQDRGAFNNPRDDPLTGHLFALEGDEWRSMRHKLSPVFTSGKMKQMTGVIVDVGHRLANTMDKLVKVSKVDDGNVEIKDLCARFTTDVIGSCAFGLECDSLQDPNAEFRQKGREIFTKRRYPQSVQAFVFTNPKLAKLLRMKILPDEITKFFMSAVKNTVDYRLKNGIKRNDFIDQLIQLRAEDQEAAKSGKGIDLSKGLTLEQMAAQSFVFFVAGFETSSSTMSFCLYELAMQPDIQQRVRDEIENVLAEVEGGELNYDSLAKMSYLDQVVAETLRKHPLLPHLIRECNREYKVPNTDIVLDKGVNALIPVHNIHHDPEIYPDPEKFDPSRFDPEEVKARHPMAYLPFGDGPRNCIGLRFGKVQAKVGLVSLLRRFKFTASNRTEVPLILSKKAFLLGTENGMYLRVEKI
ncbi:probable cytochrome P450 6a14 [Drosophila takahashii]|uniref:probable cytochrome P450 6a14 n=1 Tax=Drosophila takahashii TaxID=29030 RepID=UPI001CF8FE33|nr:probable cytochrome P450 6a14 [Drosophila takahashii]